MSRTDYLWATLAVLVLLFFLAVAGAVEQA